VTVRYVVLHHTGVPDPHFDLMIESKPGGPLYTWRCPNNPVRAGVTAARRIANHRQAYLDFEGEISDNRGRVAPVAAGRCRFARDERRAWIFEPENPVAFASYWVHRPQERDPLKYGLKRRSFLVALRKLFRPRTKRQPSRRLWVVEARGFALNQTDEPTRAETGGPL
jgi:hypothetical protein